MSNKFWFSGFILLFFLILQSCIVVGPDYEAPDLSKTINTNWENNQNREKSLVLSDSEPEVEWWKKFNDAELISLINRLLENNLNLAQAYQRIIEARARSGIIDANKFPQLTLSGQSMYAYTGDKAVNFQGPPPGKSAKIYSVSAMAGWEIDFWGRVKRLIEASNRETNAEIFNYRDVAISLTSELVIGYINARALEERILLINKEIDLLKESLNLSKLNYSNGLGTEIEVRFANQKLNQLKSKKSVLKKSLEVVYHSISILLGASPSNNILKKGNLPDSPGIIGIGVPADLITRREDIKEAEQKYAAAMARIGVAMADKYPKLSLSGTLAFQTNDAGMIMHSDSMVYSFGPSFSFPLFDAGRIKSNIGIRESQAEMARLTLKSKLLNALKEVEDSASSVIQSEQKLKQTKQVEEDVNYNENLAKKLFDSGVISKLDYIDKQYQSFVTKESVVMAKQDKLEQVVRLYRALGGGFDNLQKVSDSKNLNKGADKNE